MTADLAQDVLKDVFPQGEVAQVTIERIQEVVCERFSMSLDELCSHKRSQNIVYPRQVAMYLSRELTDSSLPKIGKHFGDRDHTTVLHANTKIYEHDPRRPNCVQPCARTDRAHQTSAMSLWVQQRAIRDRVDRGLLSTAALHTQNGLIKRKNTVVPDMYTPPTNYERFSFKE